MSTRVVFQKLIYVVTNVYQSDQYPYPRVEPGVTETWQDEHKILDETKSSVSVQNPKLAVKVRVAWRPKIPVVEPKKPILYERKPPVQYERREGQSASSYARYLMKYRDMRDEYLIAQMRNRLRYDAQLKKYEKRLQKYKENVYALKNGIMSYRSLPFCKPTEQWNPYSLNRETFVPGSGLVLIERWARSGTPVYSDPFEGGPYSVIAGPSNLTSGMVAEFNLDDQLIVDQMLLEVDERALTRLRDRVNNQIAHVGNLLAERHKSMQMLGDLLKRAVALVKRRQFRWDGPVSSKVSDDFLMFQFGLKPLMSDIYALSAKLGKDDEDVTVLRFRASFKTSRDYQTTDGELIRLVHHTVKVSYVIEFQVENTMLKTLHEYGLTNPLEIAWEVLPWSFVVDWFLPIGMWIRDVTSPRAMSFKQGSKTTTVETAVTSKRSFNKYSFEWDRFSRWTGEVRGSRAYLTKNREILGVSPLGDFIPKFKSPFSAYHVAESVALFLQRFKR